MRMRWILLSCLALLPSRAWAQAADAYYAIPIENLKLVNAELPEGGQDWRRHFWERGAFAYAVLDGQGEALLLPVDDRGVMIRSVEARKSLLHVQAPAGKEVMGYLVFPSPAEERYVKLPFKIAADTQRSTAKEFKAAKGRYYARLLNGGYAGAAWWRNRIHAATGKRFEDDPRTAWRRSRFTRENTYDLVTGGRAMIENLQLDRGLPNGKRDEETVAVDSIRGVTVKEFDWAPYLKEEKPEVDPLAAHIPADQYAIFFPSFDAMLKVIDTSNSGGTPFQQAFESSAEDAMTRTRYERQLCLQTSAMARLLGPKLVKSVAFTGSDPFLREGTDVAIMFEAQDGASLHTLMKANRVKNAALSGQDVKVSEHEEAGLAYHQITSDGRLVSSYQAQFGGVVVVSNSLQQLRNIASVVNGRTSAMGELDEYRFFRQRYTRGDEHESAFIMLTDGAIRKWSSPRWRIGMSRRVRAAAAMTELEAEHVVELATGEIREPLLPNDFPAIDCGTLTLTPRGVASKFYGNSRFLTPIAELRFTHVTAEEARNYERWRDTYQSYWSTFFDPIGIQVKIDDARMAMDVTVMPLIVGSDYRQYLRAVGESEIQPTSGDPHPEAFFHFMFAFDPDSEVGKSFSRVFSSWPGNKPGTNPLRWMGNSISLYVDRDPFFAEALKADDLDQFMQENIGRFPGAINIDVKNPLIAGMFLAGLKIYVSSAAPGYTKWSTRKHGETEYVRVEAGEDANDFLDTKDLALHYATLKGHLVIALNEDTLKKAIDRSLARKAGTMPKVPARPWLGKHIALQAHRDVLAMMDAIDNYGGGYRGELRERCWKNLPILNEWQRMFPEDDAVAMHSLLTGVRLVCPGGGEYKWNAEWKTYESTVFGHPGAPKNGPKDCYPMPGWNYGNFGVEFEKEGIRARVAITRK